MSRSASASSCSVRRSRRPQTRLEASCTRTGRPRRHLLPNQTRWTSGCLMNWPYKAFQMPFLSRSLRFRHSDPGGQHRSESAANRVERDVGHKSAWGKCTATKLLIQSRVPRSPFLDSFRLADITTCAASVDRAAFREPSGHTTRLTDFPYRKIRGISWLE